MLERWIKMEMKRNLCRVNTKLILTISCLLISLNPFLAFAQAPKNIAIYASKRVPVSVEQLKKFAGDAKLKLVEGNEKDWESVEIKWPDVTIQVGRSSIESDETLTEHLGGFAGYVFQRLAEGKMDAHVFELIRQINKTNHLYSIQSDPDISSDAVRDFTQKLAGAERALVFVNVEVFDSKMKVLLGPESSRDKEAMFPQFESAVTRKAETMKLLEGKKLKCYAELPLIVADEQVRLRAAKDVATRAVCLLALASEAEEGSDFDATEFLTKHKLMDSLSPEEVDFLKKKRTAVENSGMTWRYEAVWSLLWALDKVDTFGFPDKQSDAKLAIKTVMEDPTGLIENAKLRPTSEILNKADLLYRCMWICRDAQGNGKQPEGLSMSVVYERLYALNWLIQHGNATWDNVQTDS